MQLPFRFLTPANRRSRGYLAGSRCV